MRKKILKNIKPNCHVSWDTLYVYVMFEDFVGITIEIESILHCFATDDDDD